MVYNICKNGIANEEEWDESDWYNAIAARRSFFIVSRKKTGGSADDSVLERVFLWSMPHKDIEAVEVFWRDTRDKVRVADLLSVPLIDHIILGRGGAFRSLAEPSGDMTDGME